MTAKEKELVKLLCDACDIIDMVGHIELMKPPLASWYFSYQEDHYQEKPDFNDPGDSQ